MGFYVSLKKIISIIFILIILTACDENFEHPDMRHYVPNVFPITELVYSRAMFLGCAVNVFKLENTFKENFQPQILEDAVSINIIDKYDNEKTYRRKVYEPWQETPIYRNTYDLSKIFLSISEAEKCFEEAPHYNELLQQYSQDNAYFTYVDTGDGLFLLLIPTENILILTNWD